MCARRLDAYQGVSLGSAPPPLPDTCPRSIFSHRSTILMSIDAGELDAGREACPVLPCVQYPAINADRIGQEGLAGPSDTDLGQSRQLTAALVLISTAQLMVVLDATIVAVALP